MEISDKTYKILNRALGTILSVLLIVSGALSLKNHKTFSEIKIIGEINAGTFKNPITAKISIPQGAQFIASQSGKYFYPLLDTRASRIAEKNRIYFGNEAQALALGYKKAK